MFDSIIKKGAAALGLLAVVGFSMPASASVMSMWEDEGYTLISSEDNVRYDGKVDPGYGGQSFDAEYLYYKLDGTVLTIGLQTGFDMLDGIVTQDGKTYYAGDLAISFNGGDYDYAVDFGFVTKDNSGDNVGLGSGNQDAAGLYSVSEWNDDILYTESSPFAMDEGTYLAAITTTSGYEVFSDGTSYYITVSFDLAELGIDVTDFDFLVHWTMSCGNDAIEGSATVPEPAPLLLLGAGLIGLMGSRKLRATRG